MKSKITILLIMLCMSFYSRLSISGSPGGLILFVMPMGGVFEDKHLIDDYFKKHYGVDSDLNPGCEISLAKEIQMIHPQVDVFYLHSFIMGVDSALLASSIDNQQSRSQLRRFLINYEDRRIHEGFDAILFYKLENEIVYFYGLSAIYKPEPLKKSSIAVSDLVDENKLGHALCLALAGLPTPAP